MTSETAPDTWVVSYGFPVEGMQIKYAGPSHHRACRARNALVHDYVYQLACLRARESMRGGDPSDFDELHDEVHLDGWADGFEVVHERTPIAASQIDDDTRARAAAMAELYKDAEP